jgi:opine dehydrogenase
MNIAIIGDNAQSIAAACDFNSLGLSPLVYTKSIDQARVWRQYPVTLEGSRSGKVHLNVTNDLRQAMVFASVILITAEPIHFQETIEELSPFLHEGQSLLFTSGPWGVLKTYRLLQKHMESLHLSLGETAFPLWEGVLSEDGLELKFHSLHQNIAYSSVGKDETLSELLHMISKKVTRVSSPAMTSLAWVSPLIHLVNAFFNLTRIDRKEKFLFYGDAFTRNTADFIERCDEERIAVGKALGVNLFPLLNMMNETRKDKADSLYEALTDRTGSKTLYGPQSFDHPYFSMDLPCQMNALYDLAEMTRTPIPYLSVVVHGLYLYLKRPYKAYLSVQDLRTLRSFINDKL